MIGRERSRLSCLRARNVTMATMPVINAVVPVTPAQNALIWSGVYASKINETPICHR